MVTYKIQKLQFSKKIHNFYSRKKVANLPSIKRIFWPCDWRLRGDPLERRHRSSSGFPKSSGDVIEVWYGCPHITGGRQRALRKGSGAAGVIPWVTVFAVNPATNTGCYLLYVLRFCCDNCLGHPKWVTWQMDDATLQAGSQLYHNIATIPEIFKKRLRQ